MVDNKKHVLWMIIDGCHAETFHNLYTANKLPNLRRAMGEGLRVERATTCFPSVTAVCLASLATGRWFKNTGLTGNVWYDRTWNPFAGRAYLSELDQTLSSYDRSLLGWPEILLSELHKGGMINNDIYPEAMTIYERLGEAGLTSYVIYNYVGRGANIWRRPSRVDMINYAVIDKLSHDYARFDRLMISAAIDIVRKNGLPDLLSIYFGGNDGNSHYNGVGTQSGYLQDVVDVQLGRLFNILEKQQSMKEFRIIVSADHGQTGFPRGGEHKALWIDKIEPMLRDAGPGTFVDGGEKSRIDPAANVVYSIGTGASNGVYIGNRATGKWGDSPRFEQDVLPVAHAICRASDPRFADRPTYIGEFLDFLVVRTGLDKPYMIYEPEFPYERAGRLVPPAEFFAGKEDRYPDAVAQLSGLESPTRGPDLIYVVDYDRGGWYFAGDGHLGNHGAMTAEDTLFPLMFSGPDITPGVLPNARVIDIAPTIASLFGLDMPTADGVPLKLKK